jgi:hypothetical protein
LLENSPWVNQYTKRKSATLTSDNSKETSNSKGNVKQIRIKTEESDDLPLGTDCPPGLSAESPETVSALQSPPPVSLFSSTRPLTPPVSIFRPPFPFSPQKSSLSNPTSAASFDNVACPWKRTVLQGQPLPTHKTLRPSRTVFQHKRAIDEDDMVPVEDSGVEQRLLFPPEPPPSLDFSTAALPIASSRESMPYVPHTPSNFSLSPVGPVQDRALKTLGTHVPPSQDFEEVSS